MTGDQEGLEVDWLVNKYVEGRRREDQGQERLDLAQFGARGGGRAQPVNGASSLAGSGRPMTDRLITACRSSNVGGNRKGPTPSPSISALPRIRTNNNIPQVSSTFPYTCTRRTIPLRMIHGFGRSSRSTSCSIYDNPLNSLWKLMRATSARTRLQVYKSARRRHLHLGRLAVSLPVIALC